MAKLPRLDVMLGLLHSSRVEADTYLDLGCRDEGLTVEIAKIVQAREVCGIDIDDKAPRKAQA